MSTVKAQLPGVFYRRPSPEAEPYVAPFVAHPSPIVRAAAVEALAQLD